MNLLRSVDNKITARIQRALVQLSQITIQKSRKQAIFRPQHNRNLSNKSLLMRRHNLLLFTFVNALVNGFCDIDIKWSRVSQIAKPRLVWHHGRGRTVFLPVGGFWQVDLLEFQDVLGWFLNFTRSVLRLGLQFDLWRIFHNSLYRHLNKLIETVQLLSDQTFFIEIRIDDDPAGFLPDVCCDLFTVVN